MYQGKADWEIIARAGELIRNHNLSLVPGPHQEPGSGSAEILSAGSASSSIARSANGSSSGSAGKTLFLGNGDITSLEQALEYTQKYQLDGVLIGRGFLGKPWLLKPGTFPLSGSAVTEAVKNTNNSFSGNPSAIPDEVSGGSGEILTDGFTISQIFDIILEHARLQEKFNPQKFYPVRKHLAWYCKGFKGASNLRQQLVLTENYTQVENILKNFLTILKDANNLVVCKHN
jgi:tRNA-dihydrouridine synthase